MNRYNPQLHIIFIWPGLLLFVVSTINANSQAQKINLNVMFSWLTLWLLLLLLPFPSCFQLHRVLHRANKRAQSRICRQAYFSIYFDYVRYFTFFVPHCQANATRGSRNTTIFMKYRRSAQRNILQEKRATRWRL